MLKMIKGCKIYSDDILNEEYETGEFTLVANVNADKIYTVFIDFIQKQNSPLFFILELPANEYDEKKLRTDESSPMHKDIYYIDGLTAEQAVKLLQTYGDLLINDGLSSFGFGTQDNNNEIMSKKYNIVTIWSKTIEKYNDFFESFKIYKTQNLVTAWDTFNNETPGESFTYKIGNKSVYSLPEDLKEWGIYFAEQRED